VGGREEEEAELGKNAKTSCKEERTWMEPESEDVDGC
jgi:hypothetical protein